MSLESKNRGRKPLLFVVGEPETIINGLIGNYRIILIGNSQNYSKDLLTSVDYFYETDASAWFAPDFNYPVLSHMKALAVISTTERWIPTASAIAAHFQLPGACPLSLIPFFYDKVTAREMLSKLGYSWPNLPSQEALKLSSPPFDGPYILKPTDGTGSNGVSLFQKWEDIKWDASHNEILEKFISGPEYSLDAFSHNGTLHVLGVAKKATTFEGSFVESSHFIGGNLPFNEDLLVTVVQGIFQKIGYLNGPSHIEFKYLENRFYFIEFHCRPGGDEIPTLCKLANAQELFSHYGPLLGFGNIPATRKSISPSGNWAFIQFFSAHPRELETLSAINLPCNFKYTPLKAGRPDRNVCKSSDRTASLILWGSQLSQFEEARQVLSQHSIQLDEVQL